MDANVNDYFIKEPFKRIIPDGNFSYLMNPTEGGLTSVDGDKPLYQIVTQADFMREFEVTGHKINNDLYYPNKTKIDPKTEKVYTELVARCAFPFQYVITIKQLTHLCGNQIKFTDSSTKQTDESKETLSMFKQGWINKNMEVAWFESAKAEKITGDCAFCAYMDGGKFGWKVFSFLDGDILYPHRDSITGRLSFFIRRYSQYDEKGRVARQYAEVWDDRYLTRFVFDNQGMAGFINRTMDSMGLNAWRVVEQKPHGFSRIPIEYHRSRIGACWSPSQDSIDNYEMAVSQLCENNKKYAFPILFLKGGDIEVEGLSDGRPLAISSSDTNADAKMVSQPDGSESFKLQLEILLKNIFLGSFVVLPPEVRSGDLSGVAIKLIYSPAVEMAMADAKEWNSFVDGMTDLFREGYGLETGNTSRFNKLEVTGTIVPYVHQNEAEVVENLFKGVTGKFMSVETASEEVPKAKSDEYQRLLNQVRNELLGLENGNESGNNGAVKPVVGGEKKPDNGTAGN